MSRHQGPLVLVDPDGFEVVINRGTRDGLKPGQRFPVFAYGPEVTDPDTGENLGRIELVRGQGEVVQLQDSRATIRSVEKRPARPGWRVVRDSTIFALVTAGDRAIEEEWPADESLPFPHISVGDLAKPV